MNHHTTLQRPRLGRLVLATGLVIAMLNACSSKPPACGDEQTTTMAKSIILDQWKALSASYVENFKMSPEATARYNAALKLELREIVSDGYNADARKHSCTGVFVVTTVTGRTFTATRNFTSQATADGNGKFLVQVQHVDSLVQAVGPDYNAYAFVKKN